MKTTTVIQTYYGSHIQRINSTYYDNDGHVSNPSTLYQALSQ